MALPGLTLRRLSPLPIREPILADNVSIFSSFNPEIPLRARRYSIA